MRLSWRLVCAALPIAVATLTDPARADSRIGFEIEPFSYVYGRGGTGAGEFLPADLVVLVTKNQAWDTWLSFGAGFIAPPLANVRARAGVRWMPLGRDANGPVFALGARAIAGLGFRPADAWPGPAEKDAPPNWSYSGFLGEASVGVHLGAGRWGPCSILPTFLFGRLAYRAEHPPVGAPSEGSGRFLGGTVAFLFTW
jgi:hypothetical protein